MADEFMRKDVFEAEKDRMDHKVSSMEKLVNSALARMEVMMDRNLAKHETIAERIEGRFDTLNARLDSLQNKFAWNLAWMGIVIAIVLAITQHLWR